jgi:hypothetical protein
LIRPSSKVVIKFLQVMMKKGTCSHSAIYIVFYYL